MLKKQTKRQKEIEASRQIKNFIKEQLTPKLLNDVKNAVSSQKIPDEWFYKDNFLLSKFIIDKFCVERPFKPQAEKTQKEFNEFKKHL